MSFRTFFSSYVDVVHVLFDSEDGSVTSNLRLSINAISLELVPSLGGDESMIIHEREQSLEFIVVFVVSDSVTNEDSKFN